MCQFLTTPATESFGQSDPFCESSFEIKEFSDQAHYFRLSKEVVFGRNEHFLPLIKPDNDRRVSFGFLLDIPCLLNKVLTKLIEQAADFIIDEGKANGVVFRLFILVNLYCRCTCYFSWSECGTQFDCFTSLFIKSDMQLQRMNVIHSRKIIGITGLVVGLSCLFCSVTVIILKTN